MAADSLQDRNAALAARLAERLGVGGDGFEGKLRRAGRRLPRRLRREGRYLARAAEMEAHPRLAPRIDDRRVAAAYRDFEAHLDGVPPGDLWWGWSLGVLGGLAFNLLLFAALLIALLAWRGDIGPG